MGEAVEKVVRTSAETFQCRCTIDGRRCTNEVCIDQPFCESCEDRHVNKVGRVIGAISPPEV